MQPCFCFRFPESAKSIDSETRLMRFREVAAQHRFCTRWPKMVQYRWKMNQNDLGSAWTFQTEVHPDSPRTQLAFKLTIWPRRKSTTMYEGSDCKMSWTGTTYPLCQCAIQWTRNVAFAANVGLFYQSEIPLTCWKLVQPIQMKIMQSRFYT